jgi:signal transduction histidine kinase
LAHIGDAVVLVDDDGIVRSWNPAAESLFEVDAARAIGAHADEVLPELAAIAASAPMAGPAGPVEIGGMERWLSATVSSFEGGRVFAVRDLSAERDLERQRTEFVATASHELRTPVAAAYGAAQTLREHGSKLSDDNRRRLMQVIEQETERLAEITDQMLVASQSDRGQLRLSESECDLVALCRNVVQSARFSHSDDVTVSLSAPNRIEPFRCDEARLRRVLVNLVENAIKYSPEGGRIEVRVVDDPESIRISVSDEGLGIPDAEQERIFEKFYRLDPQMTRGIGGSGLGLHIARQIIREMGGEIAVRSTPGEGSTFTIELPRRSQTARRRVGA